MSRIGKYRESKLVIGRGRGLRMEDEEELLMGTGFFKNKTKMKRIYREGLAKHNVKMKHDRKWWTETAVRL
jgi:hypothetical protein